MNHAGEGLLQAYIDGELTAEERSSVSAHLGACAVCEAELGALKSADAVVHAALSLVSSPAPLSRARAALAAETRNHGAGTRAPAPQISFPTKRRGAFGMTAVSGSLARAAALVLLVAGGAAAVIPGSPLRRWLEQGLERIASVFSARQDSAPPAVVNATRPVASTPVPFVPGAEMSVTPADGAVLIVVQATGSGELRVVLVDEGNAIVQTDSSAHGASFRSGRGRLEVTNVDASDVEVRLPRSLRSATIEVNGRSYLEKDGDQYRAIGPLIRRSSDEIVFRTGS